MKKLELFFSFILLLIFVFMVVACSGGSDKKGPKEIVSDGRSTTSPSGSGLTTFSEEPYEIAIENMTLGQDYPHTAEVEKAINAITLPKINCTVKIVNCSVIEHPAKITLSAANVGKLDLINTGFTTNLSNLVSDGIVIPLNALLKERGQALFKKEGSLLKATTINGQIYAVSANLYPSQANGIGYNQQMADQYGITVPENVTLDQLTQIGKKLKKANPKLYLTTNGSGLLSIFNVFNFCETFGYTNYFCAILDPLHNTKIVNVYATKEYKNYCKVMKQWRELGYLPEDSLTSGQNTIEAFNSGEIFFQQMSMSPTMKQLVAKKALPFQEVIVATTPNILSTSGTQDFTWAIASTCERPDKAMDFLNLLYSNAELANLLSYGLEGNDYVKVSNHILRYPDGVNGNSVGYGSFFTIFGDACQTYKFEPATENYRTDFFRFNAEAKPLKTFGYVFDAKNVESEISEVSNVVAEYKPILECGMADDVDDTLKRFNKELEKAGINKIIKENQSQLDAWLAKQ